MSRSIIFWSGLFIILGARLCAQVTVELEFDKARYLSGERLMAIVKVTNFSGQPLTFGKDDHWLRMSVRDSQGKVVRNFGVLPVTGVFTVQNAERGIRKVDISSFYDLRMPGHYGAEAVVRVDEVGQNLVSPLEGFDIIRGAKIWEQVFGSRDASRGDASVVKKYSLLQVTELDQINLYFRLSDESELIDYRVFPLSTMVSFDRVEHQVDRLGDLHVLNQNGAKSFQYNKISSNGDLVKRETHIYASDRPHLRVNQEGEIGVIGGIRKPMQEDIP